MITADIYDLATSGVKETAEAYRIARGLFPSLGPEDIDVRSDILAKIMSYAVLLALGDTAARVGMGKSVADLCAALQSDIGSVDTPGLAHFVHFNYDAQITAWQKSSQSGSPELVAMAVANLMEEQQRDDRALAEAAQSLAALCAALQEERTC